MTDYRRYCVYVVPEGPLYARAARWLGWDSAAGRATDPPDLPDLPVPAVSLTARPRKYGFHGTIKPPFRLAEGRDADGLRAALERFCATRGPVALTGLRAAPLGRFVALRPEGDTAALDALAADTVCALDGFRAPPTPDETARRMAADLTDRQAALLAQWGYPFVMEEFRFHMTLTGTLNHPDAAARVLAAHFADLLPRPTLIDSLALLGEADDGYFHLLHRAPLSG